MSISEKEFAVIREISNNHLPAQRALADKTGMSLGLTNLIIKRLINKGYIKAKQLDKKKIQYMLTPKGFSEKAKKSYNFTLKTINLLKSARERIQELVEAKAKTGCLNFVVRGSGDIMDIIELAFNKLSGINIKYKLEKTSNVDDENLAVIEFTEISGQRSKIDLLEYLSGAGFLYW